MTQKHEIDIFLKHLASIYKYSGAKVSIYGELACSKIENGEYSHISTTSLVPVQTALEKKFSSNKIVRTSKNPYWWWIENRCNLNQTEYYSKMDNAIKIYVSIKEEEMYKVVSKVLEYMTEEKIVMQCKLAKEMRRDAFIIRVSTIEEAEKVELYINNMFSQCIIDKPNPFISRNKITAHTCDGSLSYNKILSLLIGEYLEINKQSNSLDKVDKESFSTYLNERIEYLKNAKTNLNLEYFGIKNTNEYKDLIMIMEIISNTLNDNLTLEQLESHKTQKDKLSYKFTHEEKISERTILEIHYIMTVLTNKHGVNYSSRVILEYLKTQNINYITRDGNVRKIIKENYPPDILKIVLEEMSWNALLSACYKTYIKYGEEQFNMALEKIIKEGDFSFLTNENYVRSYLTMIAPKEILIELLNKKRNYARENNMTLSEYILEEIKKDKDKNKKRI